MTAPQSPFGQQLSPLVALLRCLHCGESLQLEVAPSAGYPELGVDGWLRCASCGELFPVIAGTPRMLDRAGRSLLGEQYPQAGIELPARQQRDHRTPSAAERTAQSFAYEWQLFGGPRTEWRKNFMDYIQPHAPEDLRGKLLLDVGTGSGRHSAQAAAEEARIVAVDLGQSIDVARRNLPSEVLTVQADAEHLPFSPAAFDFVMSIGVLHHLADTDRALRRLVPLVKAGGHLHVYLYWVPDVRWHRLVLRLVERVRKVSTRMPFWLLRLLCYPLSLALWLGIVLPYRLLNRYRWTRGLAEMLPLKTYADYPFGVLVNDQFDRLSAPIEHRFTRDEVQTMLVGAGLSEVKVLANHGWIGDGVRRSDEGAATAEDVPPNHGSGGIPRA